MVPLGATKKELMKRIFLMALLILLGLWGGYQWLLPLWLPTAGPVKLVQIDTSLVSRLVIQPHAEEGKTYTFKREETRWLVTDDLVTRSADPEVMDAMLMELGRIQTHDLAPVDAKVFLRDTREEQTVQFSVYESGKRVDVFSIQQLISQERRDTHFLLSFPEQAETYLLPRFSLADAWPGFYRFHDPRLWPRRNFDDLSAVQWHQDSSSWNDIFEKEGVYVSHEGDTLDPVRTEQLLRFLFQQEKECLPLESKAGFIPCQALRLYFGTEEPDYLELSLWKDTLETNSWMVLSSDRPGVAFRVDSTEFAADFLDPLNRLLTYQPEPDSLLITR
jgi:hypothetical protein